MKLFLVRGSRQGLVIAAESQDMAYHIASEHMEPVWRTEGPWNIRELTPSSPCGVVLVGYKKHADNFLNTTPVKPANWDELAKLDIEQTW